MHIGNGPCHLFEAVPGRSFSVKLPTNFRYLLRKELEEGSMKTKMPVLILVLLATFLANASETDRLACD